MSSHKAVKLRDVLTKFYFFRPQLYDLKNIIQYIKNPHLFLGLLTMYIILSFLALINFAKGRIRNVAKYSHPML